MAINIHEIIGNALLEMCKTRPLASITVKEILDETGVSRQAFYNRFRDKNDLIQWVYEHKVLSEFLKSGRASSYYLNTLNFYRAINVYRDFMRQACRMEGQNCLTDFIYAYATDYDLKWHQYYYGPEPLPRDLVFASRYHSVASISTLVDWILSDNPESPEVMARRITPIRKINFSDAIFGKDNPYYAIPDAEPEGLD